jgi:PAS domain S-box-containing protein
MARVHQVSDAGNTSTAALWDLATLNVFLERAPIGLYVIDRDFRFVKINEYLARLNGLSVAEHIGRTVREVVPHLADTLELRYRKVLSSGMPITDVVGSWVAGARPGPASAKITSYYPVNGTDGETIGVVAIVTDVTEEMRVRGALREREGRYQLLWEQSNDALFVYRVSKDGVPGNFLEANSVACRMLGYTREELLGMSPSDFREDVPDPNYFQRLAIAKGRSIFERVIRTKSGAWLPTEISATVFDLNGELAVLASVRDISERKRAEAELTRTIDLNQQILSSAQEGIIVADRDIKILVWNPYMTRLTGVSSGAAVGRNAFELFPWLRGSEVEWLSEHALAGAYLSGVEFSYRRREEDKPRWLSISTGPLRNSEGHLVGTLTTLQEITQRKEIEAALHDSGELNQMVIESTGEGIAVCDRDLKLMLWNPVMETLSGLTSQQVIGRSPFDLFPFLQTKGFRQMFERALQGETISVPETEYDVPTTKRHGWALARFNPLRNSAQEVVGVLVNVREISEIRKREGELRRLSSRLLKLQDEERRRIARDLHDNFSQQVLAVKLNLAQIARANSGLDARLKRVLAETREIVNGCAKEFRSLSYVLHPPLLDELGLTLAIAQLAEGFGERTGIRVEVEIPPQLGRLPQEQETTLFRIVQESLSNVQKHSGSKTARIRLVREKGKLQLEVVDHGRWKVPETSMHTDTMSEKLGVGILGMRERMQQLGGMLEISSGADGTTVRAVLPQPASAAKVTNHR